MRKNVRRILSFIVTLEMVLAVMPVFSFSMRAKATTTADGFEYEVNEEGKITITGYRGQGGDIVIPAEIDNKPVVGVGDTVFYNNDSITSVTFEGNVDNIGYYAFFGCSNLTSIIFKGNVDYIGDYAFGSCNKLTSVTFEGNVDYIGDCAFLSCRNLTSIIFKGNVGEIAFQAFRFCDVDYVYLPQKTVIGEDSLNEAIIYTYVFSSDTYTGESILLEIKYGNNILKKDRDYTVTYKKDGKSADEIKDPGEYTISIKMTGQYSGQTEIKHIIPYELSKCYVMLPDTSYSYDGNDFRDTIAKDISVLFVDNKDIISSEYYTVDFLKEGETEWNSKLEIIEAGKYKAKVKGNGKNTTGEEIMDFEIKPAYESFDVNLKDCNCTYDGKVHYIDSNPASSAKSGTTSFEYSFDEDSDFVSDLSSLTLSKKGSATIYVRATNPNYFMAAKTKATLTIDPKPLTIIADSDTKACDGSALTKDSYTNTDLATGDRIESVTITGSQTGPGSSDNVPNGAKIVNSDGEDVTSCYVITYVNGTLTVEDHDFDQKVATVTYLDEDADFTHAARYYYSCKCGKKGTKTFEAGEPLPTYTIIFDANGGSVNTASDYTNAEYKLDSLPTPEYDGYNFLGWFTNETGGDEITTSTVFGANMTIYAHWEKKEEPKPAQGGTEKPETPTEPSVPETPATPETPETPSEPETEDVKEETKSDYLDELYALLREAIAKGEEQTINWSAGDSLPYDVMKILEENPQITLVFNYTYMGEDFNVTIRGRDVQADPKVKWCGPLYLYSIYGGYKTDENGLKESGTYIVQAGDTLSALAAKFNTTIKNLVALNNIKDENLIFIGQELKY